MKWIFGPVDHRIIPILIILYGMGFYLSLGQLIQLQNQLIEKSAFQQAQQLHYASKDQGTFGAHSSDSDSSISSSRIFSPFPFPDSLNYGVAADDFLMEAWNALQTPNSPPFSKIQEEGDHRILRYAVPQVAQAQCVECHNSHPETLKTNWKEGMTLGIVIWNVPLNDAIEQTKSMLAGVYLVFGFLVTVLVLALGVAIGALHKGARIQREIVDQDEENDSLIVESWNESQEYLSNIIRSMLSTLILINPDATIRAVNRETINLLEYKEHELIGNTIGSVIATEEQQTFWERGMEVLLREGHVRDVESTYVSKTGKRISVIFAGSVMHDQSGDIQAIVCVAQDITLRVQAETELKKHRDQLQQILKDRTLKLEHSNQELNSTLSDLGQIQERMISQDKLATLGELTAGIAHEVRNPLTFVNNFAYECTKLILELKAEYDMPMDKRNEALIVELLGLVNQSINSINKNGKRANNIITSMLNHSRDDKDRRPTDINELLREDLALAFHSMRATQNPIPVKMITNFDEEVASVSVISQSLSRVFLNLLNNGMQALSQKFKEVDHFTPAIYVETHRKGGQIEIRIKDTGIGIAPENKTRVFEPFFTTKPIGSGTGLGLSLSREIIVKDHQGTMDVLSEYGEYTEFVITLPDHNWEQSPPS